MSLEQTIQENTNVLRELIEAIGKLSVGAPAVAVVETKPTDAKGAVAAAKAAAQKEADYKTAFDAKTAEMKARNDARDAADQAKTEAEAKRVADELEAKEAADLVGGAADDTRVYDYQKDVAPLLNELLKKDKPALLALLAKYGAKNGAGIKAADYPKVVAELSI